MLLSLEINKSPIRRFDSIADLFYYFQSLSFLLPHFHNFIPRFQSAGVFLIWQYIFHWVDMEGDTFSGLGNGSQLDGKVMQTFQKSFSQVQNILDQNRILINEINQNHESKVPDNLSRNVGLIRELNNNIRRVVDLYSDLSNNFSKSMEASSEGESSGALKSDGKASHKRIRPG
ncbi:protein ELF4-LIKE 4-like isoform X1 [Apium graveolens]|uniref:protein ELF4-LIKE 4-like isoform X1 n=2 Tax=Apium graveolens TaxID=4045 RepID=UPI003D7B81A8